MQAIEVIPYHDALVLRGKGSELVILPSYLEELKNIKQSKEFVDYFMKQALVNRTARKLFEAWLKKDRGLWQRIYDCVRELAEQADQDPQASAEESKATAEESKASED